MRGTSPKGVFEPRERLIGEYGAAVQVDDRLDDHPDPVAFDHVRHEPATLGGLLLDALREDHHLTLAIALGCAQGYVRLPEQRDPIVALAGLARHANRGADRLGIREQRPSQPMRDRLRPSGRDERRELVAAEATDEALVRDDIPQALGGVHQGRIPGEVPTALVERAEVIEVEHDHAPGGLASRLQTAVSEPAKGRPVERARQRIEIGLPAGTGEQPLEYAHDRRSGERRECELEGRGQRDGPLVDERRKRAESGADAEVDLTRAAIERTAQHHQQARHAEHAGDAAVGADGERTRRSTAGAGGNTGA